MPFIPIEGIHESSEYDILLVHSIYDRESFFEFLKYLKMLDGRKINLLSPYIMYSRSASALKNFSRTMKKKYSISKILSIDLHDNNTHGLINISMGSFWNNFIGHDAVMVAPDDGAAIRSDYVYDFVLNKTRFGRKVRMNDCRDLLFNDRLYIVDDIIDTGATATAASKFMRDYYGCEGMVLCATHGVFLVRPRRIAESLQKLPFVLKIYTTDSVMNTDSIDLIPKCSVVNCLDYIGKGVTQALSTE
jgi:phosphoribosylpyrophosphate synthetase